MHKCPGLKWKLLSRVITLCDSMDYTVLGYSSSLTWRIQAYIVHGMDYTVHGILQARLLEWVGFPFSRGIFPTQVLNSESPTLWADSLPAESQGKPKDTRVGSLTLLQRIFLTQESNWGLLHCRRILYQVINTY